MLQLPCERLFESSLADAMLHDLRGRWFRWYPVCLDSLQPLLCVPLPLPIVSFLFFLVHGHRFVQREHGKIEAVRQCRNYSLLHHACFKTWCMTRLMGRSEWLAVLADTVALHRHIDRDSERSAKTAPEREPRGDDESRNRRQRDDESSGWARSAQGLAAWHSRNRGWLQRSGPAWRRVLMAAGGECEALSRIPDGVAADLAGVSV